jgi:hypothetical protein
MIHQSSDDSGSNPPARACSLTKKRLRLVDFDFLQELYEKATPSDYKQKLWKVIDTSINGRQLTNQHPVTSQHNTLTTNSHMASEMDASRGDKRNSKAPCTEYPPPSGKPNPLKNLTNQPPVRGIVLHHSLHLIGRSRVPSLPWPLNLTNMSLPYMS